MKWALVTGASQRLGKHMAKALAKENYAIGLHYWKSQEKAEKLKIELEESGTPCKLFQADLSHAEERKTMMEAMKDQDVNPSVLINSASLFPEQSIWDWTDQDLNQMMSLHVTAARDLSLSFRSNRKGECIINMLDCRIQDYDKLHVAYHLSKKALFQLTRMMAVELAPRVRVNAIAPGLIIPPPGQDQAYLEERRMSNLLQKYGSPQDISAALLFLLKSSFITGQVIYVDGGRSLKGAFYG